MRKVKCRVVQIANVNLLVCRGKPGEKDYVFSPKHNTWGKRMLYLGDDVLKVIACDNRGYRDYIAFLPEFVMEAYNKGIRDFEIIYDTKTEIREELRYNSFGLLQVTHNNSKKQSFTRAEVLNMLESLGKLVDEEWLDLNY